MEIFTYRLDYTPISRLNDSYLLKAYLDSVRGDGVENVLADEKEDHKGDGIENVCADEEEGQRWNVGDYCQAVYSGDGLFYECKITRVLRDYCTVKFLGYNNTEDVRFEDLVKSNGKEARREQMRIALVDMIEIVDIFKDSSDGDEGSDPSPRHIRRANHSAANRAVCLDPSSRHICRSSKSAADGAVYADHFHRCCCACYSATAPSEPAPARHCPSVLPRSPGIHAPPIFPQDLELQAPCMLTENSALPHELSAMLNAWYMSGYYTGLHQARKLSRGCHCCSN